MRLSIIMPVLNEAETLAHILRQLAPFQQRGHEIIVVDGGSRDASFEIATRAGVQVLCSAQGRAAQMNAGASAATGEVLLFLHADTQLPANADAAISAALSPPTHCWGRFDVRIAGSSPMFPVISFLINVRSRLSSIATGDQAMFVTRAAFAQAGGFLDQPLMEDIELSKRLKSVCPPVLLRERVNTSGRRWDSHGVWRTIVLMWRLRWAYWRGVPATELVRMYK